MKRIEFFVAVAKTATEKTLLPPANEVWGEVMLLHLSVILFTMGGVYSIAGTHPLGRHPLGRHPPHLGRYPLGRYPPGQTPLGRHPLGKHPLGRHPSLGRQPIVRHPPRRPPSDTTGYGQQAGGTHPTGMHTCFVLILAMFLFFLISNTKADDNKFLRNEPA